LKVIFHPGKTHNYKRKGENTMDGYDQLLEVVSKFPVPIPKTENLRKILEIILTEEEAGLAAKVPNSPMKISLTKYCEKNGVEPEIVRPVFESMADKGVIWTKEKNGEPMYALFPLAPGFIEFQFMKGETDARSKKLAEVFHEYYFEGFGKQSFAAISEPVMRAVPIEKEIPLSGQQIHPYEKVKDLILSTKKKALTTCFCRHEYELLDKACDKPKDVCMVMGNMSDFAVERGFARLASDEEMLMALDRAEEAGLVHTTSNTIESAGFMCNCCGCCCGVLGTITKLNIPGAVAHSHYIVAHDEDACIDCGDCVDRCQLHALTMSDEKLNVDLQRCIGCGLCMSACESDAIKLERRKDDDILEPYKNPMELGLALMKGMQKGR
jgi:H+/Na+-translocating ferredoxin:NAD+ oxidoreductase subunit B